MLPSNSPHQIGRSSSPSGCDAVASSGADKELAPIIGSNAHALTQETLRETLHYDPLTGEFHWLHRPVSHFKSQAICNRWNGRNPGKLAGSYDSQGYHGIVINDKRYGSHRLAWLYVHGEWPPHLVDHINLNPGDNRLVNLRLANNRQNMCNVGLRRNNTSGLKGIDFRRGKWRAQIRIATGSKCLGHFSSKEEAHEAYKAAAIQLHGEFARFE